MSDHVKTLKRWLVDVDNAGAPFTETEQRVSVAIRAMLKENTQWRRFAWLIHGHQGLYGDDGEMQCQAWDFKRFDAETLIPHAREAIQEKIKRLQGYQSMHEALEGCVKIANSERDGALARIEAALALHQEHGPCPTVEALRGEKGKP